MKRIVSLAAIVLTLTMALSLAACGEEPGTNENTENGQNQTSSNETGKTVDLAALRTQFVTDYSLTDVLEAYGVVRTVPAPGLFAKIHGCIVFRFSNFSHTVLSPLQARMRRFKTASRGDAGILREQANKRCSPLFACSHVRVFASLPGRKDGIAANDPGPMPEP